MTNSKTTGEPKPLAQHDGPWAKRELWPILGLFILFLWFYGRFAPQLYFVMDDYIETRYNLSKPLWTIISDSFSGELDWSGYRPLTYSVRALFSHWLRLDWVIGYYLFGVTLHFINTWLVLHISKGLFAHGAWAFLAALLFMLLPSHNEAIFYMSANANLIALPLALVTVALTMAMAEPRRRRVYGMLACLTYGLAVLAYEVLLPLPLLLWLIEWRRTGKVLSRRQLVDYGGLALVAVALLALRYWAMDQRLTHPRPDYAVSTDWFHIARGYVILWGQLVFLHTSAWENYPLFLNLRAWLAPYDSRVFVSLGLSLSVGLGWAIWLQRQRPAKAQTPLFWVSWSIAWLYLFSLPFAMLSGRNPENRYVYIPSVGFAIGLTALLILGYERAVQRPLLRSLVLSLPILLISFYAYVTTSDGVEWSQASRHTRAFTTQAKKLTPAFPGDSQVFQVGIPEHVGAAYVFANDYAFQNAVQWLYGNEHLAVTVGGLKLRDNLRSDAVDLTKIYLFAYDPATYTTRLPEWVEDCYTEIDCIFYPVAPFTPAVESTNTLMFAEGLQLLGQKLSWIYRINHATIEPVLVTCWRLSSPTAYDYTFFVHFTDASGDNTLGQADHKLRQAYPFVSTQVTTPHWPLNTPVCDLTDLTEAFAPPTGGAPASVRGGVWIPDTGVYLTPATVQGYTFDQYGRILFQVSPEMLP